MKLYCYEDDCMVLRVRDNGDTEDIEIECEENEYREYCKAQEIVDKFISKAWDLYDIKS